jgi:hypothetical protein
MKKLLLALGAFTLLPAVVFANEDKITKGFYSNDAMGCMLLRECTNGVKEINTLLDLSIEYPNTEEFTFASNEFNRMLMALRQVNVKVFLADEKYFPVGHRGVYHTVGNNFFLNRKYMNKPNVLMQVMRHEGWHAAQDCMAGTIENSLIAIIKPEDDVPMIWRVLAERTYPEHAVPWEAEAGWAGRTEGMTQKALEACAAGEMWKVYPPTPLTKKYLVDEGYIKP